MPDTITQEQRSKIVGAIREAEKKTSAEIFAVLAVRSDDYRYVAYSFLAVWIFLVSVVLALWLQWHGYEAINSNWSASGEGSYPLQLMTFVWAQLAAFVSGIIFFRLFPRFAVLVTPRRIAHARAHDNAVKQFLAHGIHLTKERTGVLVFVSLEERYGEILVDVAIEEKIGREYFLEKVAVLIEYCGKGKIAEGLENTVIEVGAALKDDFPVSPDDKNEIEDKLIVM